MATYAVIHVFHIDLCPGSPAPRMMMARVLLRGPCSRRDASIPAPAKAASALASARLAKTRYALSARTLSRCSSMFSGRRGRLVGPQPAPCARIAYTVICCDCTRKIPIIFVARSACLPRARIYSRHTAARRAPCPCHTSSSMSVSLADFVSAKYARRLAPARDTANLCTQPCRLERLLGHVW